MSVNVNFGMPGNNIIDQALVGKSVPGVEGQFLATIALAFETRTANLIAWHAYVSAQGDLPDETARLAQLIESRLPLG